MRHERDKLKIKENQKIKAENKRAKNDTKTYFIVINKYILILFHKRQLEISISKTFKII
jgi:hypothetical protein